MRKGQPKRKTGLKRSSSPKPKPKILKPHMRPDGTPKRGFTAAGSPKVTTVTARVDKLARKACHTRGHCVSCNWLKWQPVTSGLGSNNECWGNIEWSHILGRAQAKWVRHCPDNCVSQCKGCHTYFEGHKHEFVMMIEELYPGRFRQMQDLNDKLKAKFPKVVDVYLYWEKYYKNTKGLTDEFSDYTDGVQ